MNPTPRYRQIAERLRLAIQEGDLRPGDALPTEAALCASERASRHTVREALRLLLEEGLIVRRRGSGTSVAQRARAAFAQELGSFEAILQYAREARLEVLAVEESSEPGFVRIRGLRSAPGQPAIASTCIEVQSRFAPDLKTLEALSGSITEWIETRHGVAVQKVQQRIEAVALDRAQARLLNARRGDPALKTSRRYLDASGTLIASSESLHPAGRFAYEMRIARTRAAARAAKRSHTG